MERAKNKNETLTCQMFCVMVGARLRAGAENSTARLSLRLEPEAHQLLAQKIGRVCQIFCVSVGQE